MSKISFKLFWCVIQVSNLKYGNVFYKIKLSPQKDLEITRETCFFPVVHLVKSNVVRSSR